MPRRNTKVVQRKDHVAYAVICTGCGKGIPDSVFKARKTTPKERNFCSQDCLHAYQQRTGHFTAMSQKGKEARSAAVKESNREHPRRTKKEKER